MGNIQTSSAEWTLIGRGEEVEKASQFIKGKINCLQITGLKKIGKSRVMIELHESLKSDWNCQWKDFQYETNLNSPCDWFRIMSDAFKHLTDDNTGFLDSFSGKTFKCDECKNCSQSVTDKSIKCDKWTKCLEHTIDRLISCIKSKEKHTILFLDNTDTLMNTNPVIKDCFLKFLKGCKSGRFKVVISSTKKASIPGRDTATMEIEPLTKSDTLKLLYMTTDGTNTECVPGIEDMFSEDNEVFTPENKLCLEFIVQLCDGLPLAAIMSGSLLTEYECMFSPVELLEILTQVRMRTLSPDNCPPDDRLDIYKGEMQEIQELDEQFTSFFENLTEKQSSNFSIQDALNSSGDKSMTSASMKNDVLKKLLDRCIISVRKMSRQHQWRLHGIMREAHIALTTLGKITSQPEATDAVLKFTKINAELIGLELCDESLSDSKSFERAIRCLAQLPIEDDTDFEVLENVDTDRNIPSQFLMGSSSQNNLSVCDNDNLQQNVDNIDQSSCPDNTYMNIRVPVEHGMDTGHNGVKMEARYTKLCNNDIEQNDIAINVRQAENTTRQVTEHQESLHSSSIDISDNSGSTDQHKYMLALEIDQANKLSDYNRTKAPHNGPLNIAPSPLSSSQETISKQTYTHTRPLASERCTCNCASYQTRNTSNTQNNLSHTSHGVNNGKAGENKQLHQQSDQFNRLHDLSEHRHDDNVINLPTYNTGQPDLHHNGAHRNDNSNDSHVLPELGSVLDLECHCPEHGTSVSDHSNCSYAGPRGLIYEPPPASTGVDSTHLCVLSMNEQCITCSQKGSGDRVCVNSRDFSFTSSNPYDSQNGPNAISWTNSNYSDTENITLPK